MTSDSTAEQPRQARPKFPATRVEAIGVADGATSISAGTTLPLTFTVNAKADWPDTGRYELPLALYLFPEGQPVPESPEALATNGLYLGRASIRSPRKGKLSYTTYSEVRDDLVGHEGRYVLAAWIDPSNQRTRPSAQKVFISNLSLVLTDQGFGETNMEIVNFAPETFSIVTSVGEQRPLDGTITIRALFGDVEGARIRFCVKDDAGSCTPASAWDPTLNEYREYHSLGLLPRGERLTTMFRIKLPNGMQGDSATLRATLSFADDRPATGAHSSAEKVLSLYAPPPQAYAPDTDFSRDLQNRLATARRILKHSRSKARIPSLVQMIRRQQRQGRSIDLDATLQKIARTAQLVARSATTTEADSGNLPSGLVSTIPGSRFNMPDQDFPWLKGVDVKADPPPERYTGTPFPNFLEFKRCIPFFCGPNSPSDAGKEPSQSCIRQYCGSTLEDLHYGGDNPNLLDEQLGFDKNFSSDGFGARVGVSGQAKVYHDRAISDYVAASYETNAFFGVKVFGYSVPIFEASSQSVYSPTEIGDSMSRSEFKVLGQVVEREDAPSSGLELTFRQTYGVSKTADVGVGPFSVDISFEAGGSGGLTASVEQIDALRGIVGSLGPFAEVGASARAVTSIGVGSFGIEGSLTLLEDSVPVTATFNAGLNIQNHYVQPQLDLDIRNVLDGPSGRFKLILEIEIPPASYSTTIASFSTGHFETPIYDKTTTFGPYSY